MKIRFIVNPISGTGKQNNIEEIIKKYFQSDCDIVYTQKGGDATILSQKAVDENIDVIIAVGGDGTVNECAKALIGSNTALGVIPCGSGNGFALHIGIKKDIKEAVKQLNNCVIQSVDSCTVNGEKFVNVSGIGFDAHIANLFSQLKNRGFINYLKLIKDEVFTYQTKEYILQYEGKTKRLKAYLIAFSNACQYGNDFKISPNTSILDGLIDFVIVKEFPKWKVPGFLLTLANGQVHLSKNVEIIQAKEMIINSENNLVHLDGEPKKMNSPIHIKVHPKTLKIFAPNGEK